MGKDTSIQWADSTLNLQMGCDGCELWSKTVKKCYAGRQTRGRAGFNGWPKSFEEPVVFLDRLPPALSWKDLSGTPRPEKPWLDNFPRIIFLNDMGDTFSAKLALDWMAPVMERMAASPHQFLLLTKRPSRAVEFSKTHPFPSNFWIGTSVTSDKTANRVPKLLEVRGGALKFVSFEPLWTALPPEAFDGIDWAIFGGESGDRGDDTVSVTHLEHIVAGLAWCHKKSVRAFCKQLGSRPVFTANLDGAGDNDVPFPIKDSHGGDSAEWPAILRVREMPAIKVQPSLL